MEAEPKFIAVSKEVIGVFASHDLPFPQCMNAICSVLDFMFSARKESKEEISRMMDDLKSGLLDLSELPADDTQPEIKQDAKEETLRKILAALNTSQKSEEDVSNTRDTTIKYSSKFLKELYCNIISPNEAFSIISTMLAASFSIFGFDKKQSEKILVEIFKEIHRKI